MRTPKTPKPTVDDEYIFAVCDRFIRMGQGAQQIRDWLELSDKRYADFTRERIYPLLQQGVRLGYVQLCAPFEVRLAQELATIYPQAAADIQVLNVRYGDCKAATEAASAIDTLALAAARKVVTLVKQLGRRKQRVGICFGAGRTAEAFARQLSILLRSEPPHTIPPLSLHAMSPGFSPINPRTPVMFFSYFATLNLDIEYIGLFCPAMVSAEDYEKVAGEVGAHEAFSCRGAVDIVVTSLQSADDEEGMYYRMLEDSDRLNTKKLLGEQGWEGDVQCCPFSKSEPIIMTKGSRAVSLFDLSDLVEMAQTSDKHVILISGPSPSLKPKTRGLRPLMSNPKLRVFNHLITDFPTARALLGSDAALH